MIRLLLVDDEPVIVEDLALFLGNVPDIDCLYTAASGQEAVQLLTDNEIDIVVTDIRMPGMTGIELCEYVDGHEPDVRCILLSGYAEFEYARQALKTKAAAYLLKPVKKEELLQTIRQTADELRRKKEAEMAGRRAQQTLRSHLLQLKASMLRELLEGRKLSGRQLTEEMSRLDVPFAVVGKAALVMLRMENRFLDYDEQSISLFEFAILNIAEELFQEHFGLWACKESGNYLVLAVQPKAGEEAAGSARRLLESIVERLQYCVSHYLHGAISAAASDFELFPDKLAELYPKVLGLLRTMPSSEQRLFVRLWDQPQQSPRQSLKRLYEPPAVLQLLESERWAEAEERLAYIFAELNGNGMDTADNVSELFYALSNTFAYYVHSKGLQLSDVVADASAMTLSPAAFRSGKQLHAWSLQLLKRIRERIESNVQPSQAAFIKQIRQYIERHLSEDVSLQAISDHVRLHPTYISAMYKQETGENLSEYIYRFRMEKAAYLLRNSNAKIYEIASQLGYQYTPYFTKLFKSYYGMSPQEYRSQAARE